VVSGSMDCAVVLAATGCCAQAVVEKPMKHK